MDTTNGITHDLLWAYSADVPSSGRGNHYYLPRCLAWLMLRGEGDLVFESTTHVKLSPNMWYLPSPSLVRSQRFSADAQLLSICFRFESPDGNSPLDLGDCVSMKANDVPGLAVKAKKLVHLTRGYLEGPSYDGHARTADLERQLATKAVFLQWLLQLLKALKQKGIRPHLQPNFDVRLQKMMNFLNGIIRFAPVPYRELRSLSFLGRVQIDRLFKENLDLSPHQFMARNLLAHCKERLVFSDLLLKELASKFDFPSTPQFCAWFKHHTGVTPSLFRKKEKSKYANRT